MSQKRFALRLAVVTMACISVTTFAQGTSPDAKAGAAKRRIILDTVVTDASGNPVKGLTASDFSVSDKGQPEALTGFQAVNAALNGAKVSPKVPTEVSIVIDTVNAVTDDVSYERAQLGIFLKQNPQLDFPVTILLLSENGLKPIAPGTTDGNALANAVEKIDANFRPYRQSQGFYGALERMKLSTHALGEFAVEGAKRPGRKVLIWLGRGWPYLQGTDAETNAKQTRMLFDLEVSLSTLMRQARVTVYAIDTNRVPGENQQNWMLYTVYSKPTSKWSDAAIGHVSVQVLALQSGGLPINKTDAVLSEQLAKCIAEASVGYVLLFDAPPATQKDEFHDFKVTVNKPGVTVRTRVGYYDQP